MLAISNASSNVSQPVSRQQRPRNVPPPRLKEDKAQTQTHGKGGLNVKQDRENEEARKEKMGKKLGKMY